MKSNILMLLCLGLLPIILVLIYLALPGALRTREKLRWQFKTQEQLEKAIANGEIDIPTAKRVISQPRYGIHVSELVNTLFLGNRDKIWEDWETAKKGWEISSVFLLTLLFGVLSIGGLVIIGFALFKFVQAMDVASIKIAELFAQGGTKSDFTIAIVIVLIVIAMVIGFIIMTIKMIGISIKMMRYR